MRPPVLAIPLAVLGVLSCRQAHSDRSVAIGHYGSMSGSEATFGQSTARGIRLAVQEINRSGGIKGKLVELKSYDDRGSTQEAGTAVTRLITSDKVVAIVGENASSLSLAGG